MRWVHDDAADGALRVIVAEAADVAGLVAAALLDLDLHLEAAAGEVGDHVIGIEHRDVVRQVKVGGGDDALAVLAQHDRDLVALLELEDDALEVEEDVNDVFEHAVDLGVLVDDARDLGLRRSEADHRGEQDAAKRIAERVAVAALERLERDDGLVGVLRINVDVDAGGLEESCVSHLLGVPLCSIPSARYTDKAERIAARRSSP